MKSESIDNPFKSNIVSIGSHCTLKPPSSQDKTAPSINKLPRSILKREDSPPQDKKKVTFTNDIVNEAKNRSERKIKLKNRIHDWIEQYLGKNTLGRGLVFPLYLNILPEVLFIQCIYDDVKDKNALGAISSIGLGLMLIPAFPAYHLVIAAFTPVNFLLNIYPTCAKYYRRAAVENQISKNLADF